MDEAICEKEAMQVLCCCLCGRQRHKILQF